MPANNEVGAKIKGLREMRGVTIEDLAERSHLTVEQVNQIETGETIPSLTPLLAIARGLGVRLGTFLDDIEMNGPVITRSEAAEAKPVRFGGTEHADLDFHALATNKRDRSMEPFIIDIHSPSVETFDVSSHEGEEFIYVLSGELEVIYGKKTYRLAPGDSIYYDSIVPHHVHSVKGVETRILAVVYAPH